MGCYGSYVHVALKSVWRCCHTRESFLPAAWMDESLITRPVQELPLACVLLACSACS